MGTKLSPAQTKLIAQTKQLAEITIETQGKAQPLLVHGHTYFTACALERKGIGTVRYQGQSMGWFSLKDQA